ncbi:MAG: RNA polymerase sigma factor, partial [Solirubrobacteraceae bacterium]
RGSARARARRDEPAARRLTDQLLAPHLRAVATFVFSRAASLALRRCDCEEIAAGAFERIARELGGELDTGGVPIAAIAIRKTKDELSAFLAQRARRWLPPTEELTAPEDLPEPAVEPDPTAAEQAAAAVAILRPLGRREREMLYERHVLDLGIGEVAARRGVQPDTVKKATTRGVRKIREAQSEREALAARLAQAGDQARERGAGGVRYAPAGRHDPAPIHEDPNSMSTFAAPHSGLKDEGPRGDAVSDGPAVGLSNQKGKSEPQDIASSGSGKRGR